MAQSNNVLLPALVTFDGQADFGDDVRHTVNSYNDRSRLSVSFGAAAREHRAMMRNSLNEWEAALGSKTAVRSMLGPFASRIFVILASIFAGPFFFLTAAQAGEVGLGQNIADAA